MAFSSGSLELPRRAGGLRVEGVGVVGWGWLGRGWWVGLMGWGWMRSGWWVGLMGGVSGWGCRVSLEEMRQVD